MAPNVLQMQCSRCQVAQTCPRRGSSPLHLGGRTPVFCRIVGGYGRTPLDDGAMSPETKERSLRDGPCLTIAEVPTKDEHSGHVYFEVTKVFHHPVLHPREKTDLNLNVAQPRSYNRD